MFNAEYNGAYLCSDGVCPSGLTCSKGECRASPSDAGGGDGGDTDSGTAQLLTCQAPGMLSSGVTVHGSTVGRADNVWATCATNVGEQTMHGADAVYAIAAAAGASLKVSVTGNFAVFAYALYDYCVPDSTALVCEGSAAWPSNPITLADLPAGTQYVVVDAIASGSADTGSYALTVTTE